MPFNPDQPFEIEGQSKGFDPSQPFEVVDQPATPPTISERAAVPKPELQAGPLLDAVKPFEERNAPTPTAIPRPDTQAFPAREQALAGANAARARQTPIATPEPSEAQQQAMLTGVAQPESEIQPVSKPGTLLRGVTSVAASVLNRPEYLAALANPATAAAVAIRFTREVATQFLDDLGKATQGDNEALGRAAMIGVPALFGAVKGGKTIAERLNAQAQMEKAAKASSAAHIDELARLEMNPTAAQRQAPPPGVVAEPSTLAKPVLLPESQAELNKIPGAKAEPSPSQVVGGPKQPIADWLKDALKEREKQGWDNKWPFVPADLLNKSFRDAIISDPTLSLEVKQRIMKFAPAEGREELQNAIQERSAETPDVGKAPEDSPQVGQGIPESGAPAIPQVEREQQPQPAAPAGGSVRDVAPQEHKWDVTGSIRRSPDGQYEWVEDGKVLDTSPEPMQLVRAFHEDNAGYSTRVRQTGRDSFELALAEPLDQENPAHELIPLGQAKEAPTALPQNAAAETEVPTSAAPSTTEPTPAGQVEPAGALPRGLTGKLIINELPDAVILDLAKSAGIKATAKDLTLESRRKSIVNRLQELEQKGILDSAGAPAPKPKRKGVERPWDIIDEIGSSIGTIRRKSAAKPGSEGYYTPEWADLEKSGASRKLFSKEGSSPDEVLQALKASGLIGADADVGDLRVAIERANAQRRAIFRGETPEIRADKFQAALTKQSQKKGSHVISVGDLSVGDKFVIGDEEMEVTSIDPDTGEVTVKDGRKFGYQTIPDGADIPVQKGSLQTAPKVPEFGKEDFALNAPESVEQQKARLAHEEAIAKKKADQEKIAEGAAKPLVGSTGDIGQRDLLSGGDMFSEPIRQGPGARTHTASTKPEAPESVEGTGLKNAIGDLERASYGFAERTPAEKQAMAEAWVRAGDTMARNPDAARRVAEAIEANPKRGLSGDESALLLRHKVTIENALNDAAERTITETDPARKADAISDVNRLRAELERFLDAIAKRGSEWGLEGRWRQALAYEDFTFATQEKLLRASKGGMELSDTERDNLIRAVNEHKAKVTELETHLKAQESKTAAADSARMLAEMQTLAAKAEVPPPHIMRLVKNIRESIKRGADESRKFIAGAQFDLGPELVFHLTRIAADNFLEIGENFAKWSAKMVEEVGDRIKPHLERFWEAGKKLALEDSIKASEKDKPKIKKELVKPDKTEKRQKVLDAVKEAKAEGFAPGELGRYVREIVKEVVEGGVTEHEAVFDATKKLLDDVGVVLTKDEIKQAFSDYGKSIAAPTDPVKVRLAQLRGEAQKALGLKDVLEKHQPPQATGPRRVKVSDLYRRTVAKINEALRELGITATDPERQLADALQARKTYRQNRIKDLRHELATGERIVRGKSVPIEDAELKALDKEYQALKAEHAERFPKEGPTQEQQIAAANRGLDREIAALEEQIRTGNVIPDKPRTRLSTPELEAKRTKLDALRDQRDELRDLNQEFQRQRAEETLKRQKQSLLDQIEAKEKQVAAGATASERASVNRPLAPELEPLKQRVEELNKQLAEVRNPKKSREELALNAMKRRATQRIAEIQGRLARADFSKRPRPTPVKPDAEATRLKTEVKQIEQRLAEARIKNKRANRTWGEWAQDTFVDWARATKLLSPYVFPKLVVAGITRLATNPVYRVAGQPLRLIPGLAAKASVELRMSMRAEASAVAAILKSPPQAWRKLVKGKSNLDVLEGRLGRSREMSGLIGNAHGMVKEPVRQAAFARAIEIRTQEAVRAGLNPREPAVAATIESSSLADARREIFMNENMVTQYLVRLPVEALRRSDKTGAKTLANVIEFLQPIVTVPANITIAAARLNPVIGFGEAMLRLGKAAKEGQLSDKAAKLSEADAESIARAFKYGAIGTFLSAYAWLNPDQFGGVYDEKGKKRDLKPGQVRIMGITTPSWLGHAPELAHLNTVAAARRVYDRYYTAGNTKIEAATEALAFSLMAPVKNLPFIDSYLRLFNTYHSPGQTAGQVVREATLPTAQLLKVLDDQERTPKTFWQEIEMGIPGLRAEVPAKASPKPTRPTRPRIPRSQRSPLAP